MSSGLHRFGVPVRNSEFKARNLALELRKCLILMPGYRPFDQTPDPQSRNPNPEPRYLNPARIRIPYELVNLQSQAHVQSVAQHPLGEQAWVQFPENRRKDNLINPSAQIMLEHEVMGVMIVILVGNHEFDLVFLFQSAQVINAESFPFAAAGAL